MAPYYLEQYSEAASVLKDLKSPWAGAGPMATETLCYLALGNKEKVMGFMGHFKNNGNLFAAGLIHSALDEAEKAIDYFQESTIGMTGQHYQPIISIHEYWSRFETMNSFLKSLNKLN